MLFNNQSIVVKTWIKHIQNGTYTRDQVPNIGNLSEVVNSILDTQSEQEVK